jgi:hypothetical protein
MGDNSFGNGIHISHIYSHAELCVNAILLASTLPKTINDRFMQSIIHVPIELEHLAWGTIPVASALATSIYMLSGVLMLFHWPPHYTK